MDLEFETTHALPEAAPNQSAVFDLLGPMTQFIALTLAMGLGVIGLFYWGLHS